MLLRKESPFPSPPAQPGGFAAVQAFNEVQAAFLEDSVPVVRFAYRLRPHDFGTDLEGCDEVTAQSCSSDETNPILPWLALQIEQGSLRARERLVVTLKSRIRVPRFPTPNLDEGSRSPYNRRARRQARRMSQQLERQRWPEFVAFGEALKGFCPSARILDQAWLTSSLLVDSPESCIIGISKLPGVVSAELARTDLKPPRTHSPGALVDVVEFPSCEANCVAVARQRIASNPFFEQDLYGGWIAILDTGVAARQKQLVPKVLRLNRNCNHGRLDERSLCPGRVTDDPCNHGTRTATVLAANNAFGADFRGVTSITLDSFRVYRVEDTTCTLDIWSTVRGLHAAVAALDQVIAVEVTAEQGSSVSRNADRAFDAGSIILAANGNQAGSCTVRSPAEASKVLGVGAVNVETGETDENQSDGPAPGGRIKPDIQAPTDTRTGNNANEIQIYRQTSGATPYAAGAAALLHNWLWRHAGGQDPGQTYALLILSGQNDGQIDNKSGAGPIELPVDDWLWWGKISLVDGEAVDVPLRVDMAGLDTFDGALWWPLDTGQPANQIALMLVDPDGSTLAESCLQNSVFEKLRLQQSLAVGNWTLRIEGTSIPAGRQTLYWAARAWQQSTTQPE